MPRGDGTGPMGMGPMTGRGAGFCAGFAVPGYANPIGYGIGFGRGRGFRRMFYATGLPRWARFGFQSANGAYFASDADEKEFLKRQAKFLENQLNDIKKRLEELED
ncbi:MAG: DUF5320 domain-containing protein [Clostridiales bacterium]|nr:DUF5320 domain-containing protein [Clostridiales bacterium]